MYRMAALLFATGLMVAHGQTFEVASVRIPPPHEIGKPFDIAAGVIRNDTVTFTNASLADCIRFAYGLSGNLQLSAPEWMTGTESRFDIVAKGAPGTTPDQMPKMMQALLAERFRLAFHREQRMLNYYGLVTAKGGPRMHQAGDAAVTAPAGVNGQLHILSNRIGMAEVVSVLSRYLLALVTDETGLTGEFEVRLVWTPDDRPVPEDQRGASIFTAVQEQLGLRLEARRGPMEVMVIDGAEKVPTAN